MALRGSLSDLNIVELVQIPATGHKTGELFVAGLDGIARLFYQDGRLVHLETDELTGQEVLVEILGWNEGEFEFRPESVAEQVSFETDLHRALMAALKTRDELRFSERAASADDDLTADDDRAGEMLRQFLASHDHLRFACLLRDNGSVLYCGNQAGTASEWLELLRGAVAALLEAYPRSGLHRVLFEDAEGTVVVSRLADGTALVAVADRDATLGAVSVAVERFARRLEGE